MRIALGVEYDGSGCSGWQRQAHGRTVQGTVESALSRVADSPVEVICAGRTDTGVHATAQVIHFDSIAARNAGNWIRGANSHLPDDVCIRWALPVPDDFHARFSARRRHYRYVICNGLPALALLKQLACHRLVISRSGDWLYIDVEANAFLHHMVRCIAGMLISIGRGEHPPEWMGEVIEARDRTLAGVNAPAAGLYLAAVQYDSDYGIPAAGWLPSYG
jgi:tRNA pseudouridine38-40 synthase